MNLSAGIEASLNRHLFDLHQTGKLDGGHLGALETSSLIVKILFLFKEEVSSGKLGIARVKHLIRLRNNAVHFKANSVHAISATFRELQCIWQEVSEVFAFVYGTTAQETIGAYSDEFARRWLE